MSRRMLISRIITLLIALGALIYLYLAITQPVGADEAEVPNMKLRWTLYGMGTTADKLFSRPHAVAVAKDGSIYVTDTDNQRILVFDSGRRFKTKLDPGYDPKSTKTGFTRGYLGIAVAEDGRVFVADKLQDKIYILDESGRKTGEIREKTPTALAVSGKKLYAATYGSVVVYDLRGNVLQEFGTRGSGKNQFDFPGGIAVDGKGNIYVADSNNGRLVSMAPDGSIRWTVGKKSASMNDAQRTFGLPAGLAIDDNNIIYMIDAFNGAIVAFDAQGQKLTQIGEWGRKEGQFYYPAGIAFASDRTFVIVDKFNDRLQAVDLTVPGAGGTPLFSDLIDRFFAEPVFLAITLSLVLTVCVLIAWRMIRRSSSRSAPT